MKTRVTELLGIEKPIIQGGMAWVAESHLAAAVSNAGGFGLIGAANAPADVVRNYIHEARALTDHGAQTDFSTCCIRPPAWRPASAYR